MKREELDYAQTRVPKGIRSPHGRWHLLSVYERRPAARNRTNWAGNYNYSAQRLETPKTLGELRDLVKRSRLAKALGTRHSFNGVADSTDTQISLEHLDQISMDEKAQVGTVGAGVKYGQLCRRSKCYYRS
jgi:hypothetical protein